MDPERKQKKNSRNDIDKLTTILITLDNTIISLDSPSPPSSPVNLHQNSVNNDGAHLNPVAQMSIAPSPTVINTAGTPDTNLLNSNFSLPDLTQDLTAERFVPR